MKEKQKLSEWVRRIQQGDREAVEPLIERFKPKINHLSHLLGYDGAETDLILWLLTAIKRYDFSDKREEKDKE
ncbi:hypothetical protein CULT_2630002 [[Clostridium] ultunense Esp]|uniref:hypothetical protein n=1 Tax=Thermicanus aegyptius TaxID=94009 RepID=UPI0002B6F8AF|nr:hypothetical protein [Thermicanus aegyptius]CCQ95451.1 hypothetical protein CULT_2630002 [[Clostridium] ultunense Esp]